MFCVHVRVSGCVLACRHALNLGLRHRRSEESEASSLSGDSSREVEDEMELADDATTDDEGGRGSAKAGSSKGKAKTKDKGKGKGKGKQAQGGGAFRSSSRPMRSAFVHPAPPVEGKKSCLYNLSTREHRSVFV